MKFLFKQAACIAGKDYSLGIHEISDEVANDNAYLHKLIEAKLVVDPDEVEKPKAPKPMPEHAQKILNAHAASQQKAAKPEAPKEESKAEAEKSEAPHKEEHHKSKKHK